MLLDSSLSIVNRTGAYFIARDLCEAFGGGDDRIRYWRLGAWAPEGLIRKVAARLMMAEVNLLGDRDSFLIQDRPERDGFRLFLDPLYVLRSQLSAGDVVLCHDVGPLTHPALYDERTVANYRLAYAKVRDRRPGVVFVSDWSRQQFTAVCGTDYRFLQTIPLYIRSALFDGPGAPVTAAGDRFFLTVGAFETRKNQQAALAAYRDGGFHARGIRYLLCGSRGAGHEEILAIAAGIPGVAVCGYVSDAELRWLYRNAEAFVLPSLLEGFGMPALEAAYNGLLPIVSADSALVEAVSGLCVEIPPDRPAAIASAMEAVLARSATEREATAERLQRMAEAFTREAFIARWEALIAENRREAA